METLVESVTNDLLAELAGTINDILARECGIRTVHDFIDGAAKRSADMVQQASELGWTGIGLPESVGGAGLGVPGFYVLARALGYHAVPGSLLPTLVAAQWLAENAAVECAEVLRAIVAGDECCSIAATAGTGITISNGTLSGSSGLMLGEGGYALVPAAFGDGMAIALIQMGSGANWQPEKKMWDFTRPVGRVVCEDVRPLMLWPDLDGGLQRNLDVLFALSIVADNIGGMEAIALTTFEYLKVREQFGKIIGSFQALKHRAADIMLAVVSAQQQGAQALETACGADGFLWAALAKAATSETYKSVAQDAVQLHGGVGFTWEFDCHIYLKRARLNEVLLAPAPVLRDKAADMLLAATAEGRSVAECGQ